MGFLPTIFIQSCTLYSPFNLYLTKKKIKQCQILNMAGFKPHGLVIPVEDK